MRQILIEFNIAGLKVPIYSYGFMLVMGFLAALLVASKRGKKWGISTDTLSDLGLWIMISGVLGSRLFFVLLFPERYSLGVFNFFDGGISLAGLLAGLGIVCLVGWFKRERLRQATKVQSPESKVRSPESKPQAPNPAPSLGFLIAVGALIVLVTGRVFHLIAHWTDYDWKLFEIWHGGHVYYGAIIAAVIVGLVYLRSHRIPALVMCELAAPPIVIGLAFGRIGCFLSGCCYGKVAEGLPWAVEFPRVMGWVEGTKGMLLERPVGSFPYMSHLEQGLVNVCDAHSLPVHPTQLYEFLAALIIFAFSLYYSAKIMKREGETIFVLLLLYCPFRFWIEFHRADVSMASGVGLPGLSVSQVLSVPLFIFALVSLLVLRSRGSPRHTLQTS